MVLLGVSLLSRRPIIDQKFGGNIILRFIFYSNITIFGLWIEFFTLTWLLLVALLYFFNVAKLSRNKMISCYVNIQRPLI